MQDLKASSSMARIGDRPPVMGLLKGRRELRSAMFGNTEVVDVEITATGDLLPEGAKAILMEPYEPPARVLKAVRTGRFDREFENDGERLTLSLRAMCDPDVGPISRLDIAVLTRIAVDSILPTTASPVERMRRASFAALRLVRQGYQLPQSTIRRLRAVRSERGFSDEP